MISFFPHVVIQFMNNALKKSHEDILLQPIRRSIQPYVCNPLGENKLYYSAIESIANQGSY
ncbi:hypothetical protein [Brevibacillus laterosporus]|uniref:hypothetical protein n=1 Tax=Brevibacillus laterosporus TaxID=1465 RepID=UPI003D1F22BD